MDSACVILPFFKAAPGVLHPQAVNSLNSFAAVWCCIENILLAATAEGLGCSLRIPVGEEGANVARLMGAPKDYLLPCYLGIGYPAPEEEKLEQVEPQVAERITLAVGDHNPPKLFPKIGENFGGLFYSSTISRPSLPYSKVSSTVPPRKW